MFNGTWDDRVEIDRAACGEDINLRSWLRKVVES